MKSKIMGIPTTTYGGTQTQPGPVSPTVTPGTATAFAQQNNIPVSPHGAERTYDEQVKQFQENPSLAALPGTSPHEKGIALDVPVNKQTPDVIKKLRDGGYTQTVANEPWHWEKKETKLPTVTEIQDKTADMIGQYKQPPLRSEEHTSELQSH